LTKNRDIWNVAVMEDEQQNKTKIEQLIREAFIKLVLMVVQSRRSDTEEVTQTSKLKINKWVHRFQLCLIRPSLI
jgi:hypothetical protein